MVVQLSKASIVLKKGALLVKLKYWCCHNNVCVYFLSFLQIYLDCTKCEVIEIHFLLGIIFMDVHENFEKYRKIVVCD